MRRPVSAGCDTLPIINALEAQGQGDRQWRSVALCKESKIFKAYRLTIGLHLGNRSSYYCVLDETGSVIQEGNVATSNKAMGKARDPHG